MRLTMFGGAGGVTGSKHLLEVGDTKILLDCGTFQGLPDVQERNRSFPFPPEQINEVILSHAHIDHCGMLPLLVKRGFQGRIFATAATREVASHMLADAAKIEVQDAEYRLTHHIGAPDSREPLFTPADIPAVLNRFSVVPYVRDGGDWQTVAPDIQLKLYDAGHILGSAISVVNIGGEHPHVLAYTGDVGAQHLPMLHDPEVPLESVETVLLESTYGARQHEPLVDATARLAAVINQVIARRGKIIVPAFSLGRTQQFIYILHKLTDDGQIPRVPVFVDSPLASNLHAVFAEHQPSFDKESRTDFGGDSHTPLEFRNLTYVGSKEESQQLNRQPGPFIVIAASGMMTAGRVVHHLRHSIQDPNNAVLITGYQASGTLGRRLLDGVQSVELYGDVFTVRAEIYTFNEFSAHADQTQLKDFISKWSGIKRVFLVHGEPEQADTLQTLLEREHPDWHVQRPREGETFEL